MQRELAQHIGCSRSNLIRWATANEISLNALSYKPDVVLSVCKYYERHGRKKTEETYPDVNVRSIIERNYGLFKPRQTRWTDEQIIEAAKMAGLVSPAAQAKYFSRPGAHSGSIKSLWMKKFGFGGCSINGMVHNYARELVGVRARYIQPTGESRSGRPTKFRRVILWVDLERVLITNTPKFIKEAIHTMADFQRWLWRSKDPRPLILKMIREREIA